MVAIYEIHPYETGLSKLASQLGLDMASNILKEFWPDVERKFSTSTQINGQWVILNSTSESSVAGSAA